MVLQSSVSTSPLCFDFSRRKNVLSPSVSQSTPSNFCPCAANSRICQRDIVENVRWALAQAQACVSGGNPPPHFNAAASGRGARNIVLKRFLTGEEVDCASSSTDVDSSTVNYYTTNFAEDPIVHKLRNQLGVIHPLPSSPMNRSVLGLFAFFFFVGVLFDKIWTSRSTGSEVSDRPFGSTSLPLFLEKDLQRKESVEWVNMVLGKLWKVYRAGIENWIIGLLQPVIDNLKKPDYVRRVEIKQFSLGDEPLSVRSVERRTSRRANDLQYQIGLRYTGGARMLLLLSLKFSVIPIVVPVGVRDFDIDGELWVKLRLIRMEPWVGAVSWAFVSLPKIKFELSPFRLFNLMAIPVLSMFLTKLLTEDLPNLFVRPKKIVLDFQKGRAVKPVPNDLKSSEIHEGNSNFVGELSVTILDARKLTYLFYGKTDPYVILRLGDQVIRSKKNSQTTVIGPPGEPIWNQDFHMLVADHRKDKLQIEVRDSIGIMEVTIGTGEIDLASLKDTVPADRLVSLRGGWSLFGNGSAGEILLHLTYKAYVEDEEDERYQKISNDIEASSEDEISDSEEADNTSTTVQQLGSKEESLMDVLVALLASEEFRGIVTSEAASANGNIKTSDDDAVGVSNSSSNTESKPVVADGEQSVASEGSQGSGLFWLAIAASVSVLIALNIDHSTMFNP